MILPISTRNWCIIKKYFWMRRLVQISIINSWTCLFISRLNDIFHLWTHSDIFCISLFSSFPEMLLSHTTENREVSSANSFTVDTKSSERSLMQIRKKGWPRMEPCGTPALTGNHSNVWLFSRALWNTQEAFSET